MMAAMASTTARGKSPRTKRERTFTFMKRNSSKRTRYTQSVSDRMARLMMRTAPSEYRKGPSAYKSGENSCEACPSRRPYRSRPTMKPVWTEKDMLKKKEQKALFFKK